MWCWEIMECSCEREKTLLYLAGILDGDKAYEFTLRVMWKHCKWRMSWFRKNSSGRLKSNWRSKKMDTGRSVRRQLYKVLDIRWESKQGCVRESKWLILKIEFTAWGLGMSVGAEGKALTKCFFSWSKMGWIEFTQSVSLFIHSKPFC